VLDDLSPLRQWDAITPSTELALLAPRAAVRLHAAPFQGTPEPKDEPMAENPPAGAVLDYYVKAAVSGPLVLEILDAKGVLVRRHASDDPPSSPDLQRIAVTPDWERLPEPPSAAAGLHRFVWDLRGALPEVLEKLSRPSRRSSGPWAPPGRYTVRLTASGRTVTQPLVVVRDPRLPASVGDAELIRQHDFAQEIQAERVRVGVALLQAASLRKQIEDSRKKASGASASALDGLSAAIDLAAGPPIPGPGEDTAEDPGSDPNTLRRLAASLADLQAAVESADAAPTRDARAGFVARGKLVARGLTRWQELLETDVAAAGKALVAAGLPPLDTE
jgi:hypothetical protein